MSEVVQEHPRVNIAFVVGDGPDLAASGEAVNGTHFNSKEVPVPRGLGDAPIGSITCTFTRTAGSSSKIDFEFQVSYDGGTTWTTAYYLQIQIETQEVAVTNVVRKTTEVQFYGVTHVRLSRIKNNDSSNACDNCNASVQF